MCRMSSPASPKSLKDQNRWQLWLTIAVNAVVFYAVTQAQGISEIGWKALIPAAANLVPAGFAFIATSVVNGLLTASWKARLVFLRWRHALPGHRAFSKHALADPRIDVDRLKQIFVAGWPNGPEVENKAWYKIFKEVEGAPEVQHIHREFLFMRDYTGFAALFLIGLGIAAIALSASWRVSLPYCAALALQFIVVRHVAATYGERFVCTVLAVKSAEAKKPSPPRKAKAAKPQTINSEKSP